VLSDVLVMYCSQNQDLGLQPSELHLQRTEEYCRTDLLEVQEPCEALRVCDLFGGMHRLPIKLDVIFQACASERKEVSSHI
jgi:hypothetical protein